MEKLFVPYAIALKLKLSGFDELCFASVDSEGKNLMINNDGTLGKNSEIKYGIYMPIYQQALDWLENEHSIYIHYTAIVFENNEKFDTPDTEKDYSKPAFLIFSINGLELDNFVDKYDGLNKTIEKALTLI